MNDMFVRAEYLSDKVLAPLNVMVHDKRFRFWLKSISSGNKLVSLEFDRHTFSLLEGGDGFWLSFLLEVSIPVIPESYDSFLDPLPDLASMDDVTDIINNLSVIRILASYFGDKVYIVSDHLVPLSAIPDSFSYLRFRVVNQVKCYSTDPIFQGDA